MARLRIAICLEDREYQNRFTNCIMNHYQNKFELHVFTRIEELIEQQFGTYHGVIISGYEDELLSNDERISGNYIYLYDEEQALFSRRPNVIYIEKYSDVSHIMEEVMKQVNEEIRALPGVHGGQNTAIIGVYGLSRIEYQLPIALTLAAILCERQKVLFIDLEANSGMSHLTTVTGSQGLEELMVMAESGRFSGSRMEGCIGSIEHLDYVYPTRNTDRLAESSGAIIKKVIDMVKQGLEYSIIVINLGVRFKGFFDLLTDMNKLYLLSDIEHKGGWREEEFLEELQNSDNKLLWQRVQRVEIPNFQILMSEYERTIEQWKWSEMGDYVRKLIIQEELVAEDSREYSASGASGN